MPLKSFQSLFKWSLFLCAVWLVSCQSQPAAPNSVLSLHTNPDFTLETIQSLLLNSEAKLDNNLNPIPALQPNLPYTPILQQENPERLLGYRGTRQGRDDLYLHMLTYPGNSIPALARDQAYIFLQEQMARQPQAGNSWQAIGPASILGENAGNFTIDASGRTTAILIHPTDPNTVYIAGAQGGVWRTTNGGTSWAPLGDTQPSLAIGAMTFDPTNPNIIYVGTGEPHGTAGDTYYGAGILKTTNGGTTWTRPAGNKFAGLGISDIVVSPTNPNTLFVAASIQVFGGKPYTDWPGVYKSTDGGATWSLLIHACDSNGQNCTSPSSLVMDASNPDVLYVGFEQYGIYKSVDGGTNWSESLSLANAFYRVELAISASNNQVLFAGFEEATANGTYGSLVYTTDGGDNWYSVNTLQISYCGEQCSYNNVVAIHPTNPNIVMAGGQALYSGGVPGIDGTLFRTTDGGNTWSWNSGSSANTTLHADLHAIAFAPSNPNIVWIGNDGGVYKSTDGGNTWQEQNNGIGTLQFQSVALHPTDPNIVFGGMQDNAKSKTTNGGGSWVGLDAGDGGFTAIDPFNPTYWYGTRFNISGQFMQFQRNDNNGSSNPDDWPIRANGINLNDRVLFYAPLVVDPNVNGRVYWGTHRLYRSDNRGDNWSAISGDLTYNNSYYSAISNIALLPGNSNIILVGAGDGRVQVTTNGGGNWTDVTTAVLPQRFVSDVAIADSQTMYVAYNGFDENTPSQPGHIFKTTNGGQTWVDVTHTGQGNGLPNLPVLAIALDRNTPGTIYLGTDLGVYQSTDGGNNWAPFNQGLPNVAVFDLAWQTYNNGQEYLVAATHGRSMWRMSLETNVIPTDFVYLPVVIRDGGTSPNPTPTATSPAPTTTPSPTATSPGPTATPSATATTPAPTQTPTPSATPPGLPPVLNGGFESGPNGDWEEFSSNGYELIVDSGPVAAHTGSWLAWMGGDVDEVSDLSQTFTIPSGTAVYLHFFYQVDSPETNCNRDFAGVLVDYVTVEWSIGLCQASNTTNWVEHSIDLSAYAGQTITLYFEASINGNTAISSFFLDDVSFATTP